MGGWAPTPEKFHGLLVALRVSRSYCNAKPLAAAAAVAHRLLVHAAHKRRHPDFAAVRLVRFPHITSNLSVRCKYNIVIGQFHRFRRIILDKANFIQECALLLLAMQDRGYRMGTLKRRLWRQLRLWPGIYDATPGQLIAQISTAIDERQEEQQ